MLDRDLNTPLKTKLLHAFISNAFLQLNLSVASLFHKLSFKYYLGVACTYKHHHTDTIFLYTIFVPMSRPRFMSYLCDLLFIFIFICIMINRINTDTLVLSLNFQNMFYYFYVITWMKNVNKFPNSKSSPSGCCLAFA